MNVAAPSGGASSMALFADDATKHGQSGARAAVGTYLVLVAHFSAFLVILLVGMIYLFSNHNLKLCLFNPIAHQIRFNVRAK